MNTNNVKQNFKLKNDLLARSGLTDNGKCKIKGL